MKSERKQNILYVGHDRRIFARTPVTTVDLDLFSEQTFQTSCQEIVDLYMMLQHKCYQGEKPHDSAQSSVIKVQIH